MKMKNDCQVDYIKEAFDKLYNRVMPYIDLTQLSDADTAFKELDKKVHSEIYILKKCLAESDRAVDAGLARSKVLQERISDLEQRLNNECKHGEDLAYINGQLASEDADLKANTSNQVRFLEYSRSTWRARAQHAEKEVEDLNKKIHELEKENASLRETPFDTLEALKKENIELRNDNKTLANTVEQYKKTFLAHCKEGDRLREVIGTLENEINDLKKKIHELEVEKARLKEHNDNVDLSYGHEFEFGDEVFVPWSCDPYMYIKSGQLYNPRTERLVYVGKDQHLKWFGDKFAIV